MVDSGSGVDAIVKSLQDGQTDGRRAIGDQGSSLESQFCSLKHWLTYKFPDVKETFMLVCFIRK